MNSDVEYLCGLGLSGVTPDNERIDYHHDLTCSEVLPGPGQMLDMLPGSGPHPHHHIPGSGPPPHHHIPGSGPPPHHHIPGSGPPPHHHIPGSGPPPHHHIPGSGPPPHHHIPGSGPHPHHHIPGSGPPPHHHASASLSSIDSILTSYPYGVGLSSTSSSNTTSSCDLYPLPTSMKPPLPPLSIKPTLHVEICQTASSNMRSSRIKELVLDMLKERGTAFGDLVIQDIDDPVLKDHVQSISISDTPSTLKLLDLRCLPLALHVFRLYDGGPSSEELEEDGEGGASNHWTLPAVEFHGLWDSLVYDDNIKHNLLSYAETTLVFSERGVNPLIISWNRVVLLHGPPGTGKTSLCKALAQKLSIRLSHRYSYGQLVEINSHSLFSKWFSESGKLVQKMFQKLQDIIEDKSTLVCVLIDEVESLTSARTSAFRGSEPSDAIRVVNALLTQLDHIRRYPNVLILTTSNITGAIDVAFIDRADIKQYIGMPSLAAIYKIYHTCIKELMRVGIISPSHQLLDLRTLEVMRFLENDTTRLSLHLRDIARQSEGLSGRSLRKIPFLAHALLAPKIQDLSLCQFLDGLERAVHKQVEETAQLTNMNT